MRHFVNKCALTQRKDRVPPTVTSSDHVMLSCDNVMPAPSMLTPPRGILHNDDTDLTPKGRPDFVALSVKMEQFP